MYFSFITGRPLCDLKCDPEDFEGYICAQDHSRRQIEFRNNCAFRTARKCTMPRITLKYHGRCRSKSSN